jgi:hydrogenase maturation protease
VTMIICLGNEMRGDDGAGPAIAARLRSRGVNARVENPADLLDAWAGADDVVVIDAVMSGATPGTLHRLNARTTRVPASWTNASTHVLGLAEAIELARALERLPEHLQVVGIEGHDFRFDAQLTPEVEQAVLRLSDELSG